MDDAPKRRAGGRALSGRALAAYIRLVDRTSRRVLEPPDAWARIRSARPAIMAMWHGQFMMLAAFNPPDNPLSIMVARHGDAELLGVALEEFGLELIRGAGAGVRKRDRGGAQALRAALRTLEQGRSLAMTADIPPGPARKAGLGIVTLARLSGRPILPVAAASSRFHALRTWSRFTINLPYSKLVYAVGEPIVVPRQVGEEELERFRQQVETALDATTRRAYELAGATDPMAERGKRKGAALTLYRGLTRVIEPAAPLVLGYRERHGKEEPARRGERLGTAGISRPQGRLVWVHAASVGETNAVLPLIARLHDARPEASVLLTTGTVTSARLAADRAGPGTIHQYVPLDAPGPVARFLDHWRPDLGIFVESEVWPNLVLGAADRQVPLVLVNARLSKRSFSGWRRRIRMANALFGRFALVLAQSGVLATRFAELGAPAVEAVGNLKFDSPPPPVDARALDSLKRAIGRRTVMLAASTHQGEDEIVGRAYRILAQRRPDTLLVIVPRHPERGPSVAATLASLGLGTRQRSLGELPVEGVAAYVADTIGELGLFYSLAPVAFIGGSLIEHGGQNPIEAVKLGAAIVTGPHWHNFKDAYGALLKGGGAQVVQSAGELADAFEGLWSDPIRLAAAKRNAGGAIAELGGALERTLALVLPLIPDDRVLARAS